MTITVAVVAPGAMGAGLARRLREKGARVLTSLEGRSPASRERAGAAGMEPVGDGELARAELFLSVVPPADAVALAHRMADAIGSAGTRPAYLDLNAIAPATMREVQAIVEGAGARVVDGGIVGLPPEPGKDGPVLYLSGPVDGEVERLGALGLRTRLVPGGVGAASALKLCYAGLNKGLTGLFAAMILAAKKAGVSDMFRAELAESQPALLSKLGGAMPGMLPKAYRWGPEMEEIAIFLGADQEGAAIYSGLASLFEAVAEDAAGARARVPDLLGFAAPGA